MTNAIFDGYEVCFACAKPIDFAHLTNGYSRPYPSGLKRGLFFVGLLAFGLGLLCLVSCLMNVVLTKYFGRYSGTDSVSLETVTANEAA